MNPERRRRTVEAVRSRLGHDKVSERRTCQTLDQPRSTQRYHLKRPDKDRQLIDQLRGLVEWYPRYGSERMHKVLINTGGFVNFKRLHRIWKAEHLQVPTRQRKKRRLPGRSDNGCIRYKATHRNHVWSYDFLTDRTEDGRQLKILVIIDEFTRECLAIEIGRTFTSRDVMLTLQYLFAVRGAAGACSQRQRPRVRCQRNPTLAGSSCSKYPIHQQGQSVGKRICGIVQRQAA